MTLEEAKKIRACNGVGYSYVDFIKALQLTEPNSTKDKTNFEKVANTSTREEQTDFGKVWYVNSSEPVWDKNARVIAHEIDKLILGEMRETHPEYFKNIDTETDTEDTSYEWMKKDV